MGPFQVIRTAPGDLSRDVYRFNFDDRSGRVYLDVCSSERRESARHKFRETARWERLYGRSNATHRPTIPPDVAAEALDMARSIITVGHWEEC